MARDELIIRPVPLDVRPCLSTASTSPPCAPMPGTSSGISPTMARTLPNSSGQVAPVTSAQLPLPFQSRAMVSATRRYSGWLAAAIERLEIRAARIGCAAQQDHALVRAFQEWLCGIASHVGVERYCIRA